MRMPKPAILLPLLVAVAVPAVSDTYFIDPAASSIRFTVPYTLVVLGEVQGEFADFTGEARWGDGLEDAHIGVVILTRSIDTGFEPRDAHLRSDDFFDVGRYPELSFRADRFVRDGDDLRVTGRLEMRGVTKEITVPFRLAETESALMATGTTRLRRVEFGIGPGADTETDSYVVGGEVTIHLHLLLRRVDDAEIVTLEPSDLGRLVGSYRGEGPASSVEIAMLDDRLVAKFPAQPLATLVPEAPDRFRLVGAPEGVRARFVTGDEGVHSMTLERPGKEPVEMRLVD